MNERRMQKDRRGYGKPKSAVCGHSRFRIGGLTTFSLNDTMGLVHSHPLTHRV
jgi:hypothetical protein